MNHCPTLDTKSESFIFLHQTVLTQHKKFSLVGGTGRDPILIQGGHILRDFHILREFPQFSLRFPGYFQIFP